MGTTLIWALAVLVGIGVACYVGVRLGLWLRRNRDSMATFTQGDVIKLTRAESGLEPGLYVIRWLGQHRTVLSKCWTTVPRGHAVTVYGNGLAVGDKRLRVADAVLSACQKTGEHVKILM